MMKTTIRPAAARAALILAACAALVAAAPAQAEPLARCELPQAEILMQSGDPHEAGGTLAQFWDIPDSPVLWSHTAPEGGDYARFRAALAALAIDTDPVALLEAAIEADAFDEATLHNNRLAAENAGAWIGPAGCLEMLLIGIQHGRMDTFESPTEFASFVLRSPDGSRLRIYYYTVNQDGIGRMDPIGAPVARDHDDGWDVLIGMHSHVFHPDRPELNGILAPGAADAGFHLAMHAQTGMREAWITNGVDTVRIPADRFGDFAY